MNPGKYNKRIEIWGPVKSQNDLLETTFTDEKVKTIWAQIIPQTGKLQQADASTEFSEVDAKFKCRYQTIKTIFGKSLDGEDHYIMCDGRRYDIRYILDPKGRHVEVEIFATSIRE